MTWTPSLIGQAGWGLGGWQRRWVELFVLEFVKGCRGRLTSSQVRTERWGKFVVMF